MCYRAGTQGSCWTRAHSRYLSRYRDILCYHLGIVAEGEFRRHQLAVSTDRGHPLPKRREFRCNSSASRNAPIATLIAKPARKLLDETVQPSAVRMDILAGNIRYISLEPISLLVENDAMLCVLSSGSESFGS